MRDPGKVMQEHYDLQKVTTIGNPAKLVKCSACTKRRSVGQFKAGSTMCLQCVRRAPRMAA